MRQFQQNLRRWREDHEVQQFRGDHTYSAMLKQKLTAMLPQENRNQLPMYLLLLKMPFEDLYHFSEWFPWLDMAELQLLHKISTWGFPSTWSLKEIFNKTREAVVETLQQALNNIGIFCPDSVSVNEGPLKSSLSLNNCFENTENLGNESNSLLASPDPLSDTLSSTQTSGTMNLPLLSTEFNDATFLFSEVDCCLSPNPFMITSAPPSPTFESVQKKPVDSMVIPSSHLLQSTMVNLIDSSKQFEAIPCEASPINLQLLPCEKSSLIPHILDEAFIPSVDNNSRKTTRVGEPHYTEEPKLKRSKCEESVNLATHFCPSLLPRSKFEKNTRSTSHGRTLAVVHQPPERTVYQRRLKPFPVVSLKVSSEGDQKFNYFVGATLLKEDGSEELDSSYLDGKLVERVHDNGLATFTKLKINCTSQQIGCNLRLKFSLKNFVDSKFIDLPCVPIVSDPIQVFSHTSYIHEKRDKTDCADDPQVVEILPFSGSPGQRVVILGINFHSTPLLKIRFGDILVNYSFHESGTLICHVPPYHGHETVLVSVSNDGSNFCRSKAKFHYTTK
eukprot:TRINITY_DN6645_c0_g1_i1.p1 TRINITY_DN6645_c0_g1~~TRINITY_DN6645_c0_g1_i1.p1  ORF type:complete len:560 (+),score=20.15 TRINITY_DN6645_c0_g1_i1:393-2072(+)